MAGKHTSSSRAKPVTLRQYYICEVVPECKANIDYLPSEVNLSDIGTKFINKNRHRYLIGLIKYFRA